MLSVSGSNSVIVYLHTCFLGGGKTRVRLKMLLVKVQWYLRLSKIGECLVFCVLDYVDILVCILTRLSSGTVVTIGHGNKVALSDVDSL